MAYALAILVNDGLIVGDGGFRPEAADQTDEFHAKCSPTRPLRMRLTALRVGRTKYEAREVGLSSVPSVRLPAPAVERFSAVRSEEHTSELQSRRDLVCRLLL